MLDVLCFRVFFFKQKTAYEMRISDWSSDVCSSDLLIESNSPIYAALVVAFGYSISRLIVPHDVNAFRLLFLWGRTKLGNRNRVFWGGSSYSPLPLGGMRRRGFGRDV